MFRYLIAVIAFAAGSLQAESMYFETTLAGTNVAAVVKTVKGRLAKNGDVRELKFSDVVRSQGGRDFPDYTILLSCNDKKNSGYIESEPALANLLPCSVIVYDAGKGSVKVAYANADAFASAAGVSAAGKAHVIKQYEKLGRSLALSFAAGKKSGKGKFFRTIETNDSGFEDFNAMLVSSLQGENLNVIFSSSGKNLAVHYVCSAGLGNVILKKMPEFGVFAPCRLSVVRRNGRIVIGLVNIMEVVKASEGIGKSEIDAARRLDTSVKNALDMMTEM